MSGHVEIITHRSGSVLAVGRNRYMAVGKQATAGQRPSGRERVHMPTSDEVAAWLDLAEYAKELSDDVQARPAKRTMLRIAKMCERLAFRHLDGYASGPDSDDHRPTAIHR